MIASSALAFAKIDSISKAVKAKSEDIGHGGNNEIRLTYFIKEIVS